MTTYDLKIRVTAQDMASKSLKGMKGSFSDFGKTATTAALGIGGAGIAIGGALAKMAMDAAPMEGIKKSFEGVTKSFEGGSVAMLAAMKKGSKGMITNRDLMTSFNKASMLVSDSFATELPDAMGYLSQVSAATGEDMTFMMDSLVTGIGRLSPMILDNLGIQVSLTEANETYAASIGKSASELTKAEQQTALMNQVMEKLAVNTAEMPDITDNASTKMAQLSTSFADVKDKVGLALLPTFTKLLSTLVDLASKLSENLMPAISKVSGFIGDNMKPILAALAVILVAVVVPAFITWGVAAGTAAAATLVALAPIVAPIVAIAAVVALLVKAWEKDWGGIRTALTDVWENTLRPIFEKLQEWLGEKITDAMEEVKRFWENTLKPTLEKLWWMIRDDVIPIIESIFDWLKVKVPEAFEFIKTQWNKILKPTLEKIWWLIRDNVIPIIEGVFGWLNDKIPEAFETIERFWYDTLEPVLQFMLEKIGSLVGFFKELIAKIKEVIDWLAKIKVPDIKLPFGLGANFSVPDPFSAGSPSVGTSGGTGATATTNVIMYGTTFEGVQNTEGLLETLQELAV